MRKFRISVIVLLCSLNMLFAQKSKQKFKVHKVWISKVDNQKGVKGVLFEANDSFLKIIDNKSSEIIVNVKDINEIKVRREGKTGKGALIGVLTGLGTGALIGLAGGDDPDQTKEGWFFGDFTYTIHGTSAGTKAAAWGVTLGIVGGVVGAIIGAKKEVFLINGDIKKYQSNFDKFQNYSMSRVE